MSSVATRVRRSSAQDRDQRCRPVTSSLVKP
jgi:hypothetical protein